MRTFTVAIVGGIIGTVFASAIVIAWTGPTQSPPDGNVAAPVNVGTADQVKDGGLALDSLAVFGNTLLAGSGGSYLNFGSTAGSAGYGIRDTGGTLEFKNTGGSWNSLNTVVQNYLSIGAVTEIEFSDGTTQTTAGGGVLMCRRIMTVKSTSGYQYTTNCLSDEELTGCGCSGHTGCYAHQAEEEPTGGRCRCHAGGSHECYATCCKM